jgi:hypothetical protein
LHDYIALKLLGFAYDNRSERAMLVTGKRCNSPKDAPP